jgi:AcrR family transcriptional regulator
VPSKTSKRKPRALTPDRIERAAFKVIERVGLDAFSTRKLAAELGCEAMSVYHHFPSKAHLMDALIDRFIESVDLPDSSLPWRERLIAFAAATRAAAMRQPEFFRYAALHRLNTAGGLKLLNYMLGIFYDAGFEPEQATRLFRATIGYYVIGATLDETSGYAKGPSAVNPPSNEEIAELYPRIVQAGPYFQKDAFGKTFDMGFEILLDGIEKARKAAGKRR